LALNFKIHLAHINVESETPGLHHQHGTASIEALCVYAIQYKIAQKIIAPLSVCSVDIMFSYMYGRDYSFCRSDVGLINCKDLISVFEKV
jgi:hypothetical protein